MVKTEKTKKIYNDRKNWIHIRNMWDGLNKDEGISKEDSLKEQPDYTTMKNFKSK